MSATEKKTTREVGFYVTGGHGFQVFYPSGWGVSVQFGPGHYCNPPGGRFGGNYDQAVRDIQAKGAYYGGALVFLTVLLLERLQLSIPGRTADVTQALLALLGWLWPFLFLSGCRDGEVIESAKVQPISGERRE